MAELYKNTAKTFAYLSALIELSKGKRLTGYEVMMHVRTFGFEVSPGTIYHQLRLLANDGVVIGRKQGRRTVYEITDEGIDAFADFKKKWRKPLKYAYQSLK